MGWVSVWLNVVHAAVAQLAKPSPEQGCCTRQPVPPAMPPPPVRSLPSHSASFLRPTQPAGRFNRHYDTWDAVQQQQFFSVEAFLHLLSQVRACQHCWQHGTVMIWLQPCWLGAASPWLRLCCCRHQLPLRRCHCLAVPQFIQEGTG